MQRHLGRLFKGTVIYGIGNVLNQLLNVLLLPLFTHYLSPKDYGILSVFNFFSVLMNAIFLLGFGTSIGILYYNNSDYTQKNRVIWNSFFILLLSSFIMIILGIIFIKPFNQLLLQSNDYAFYYILILISTAASILILPFMLKLQFEEKQSTYVIITIVNTLCSIGLAIALIVFMKRGLAGRIEAMAISSIIAFLIWFYFGIKNLSYKIEMTTIRNLIKYGIPMMPSYIFLYILGQGNIFYLEKYTNLEILGLYNVGYGFACAILLVINAITTAWFPFMLSFVDKQDEAKVLFGKITTYYFFIVGFISLFFFSFAQPVVYLFTQKAFHGSYIIVGLIAASQVLVGLFSFLLPPLYFIKKVNHIPLIQMFASIVYIILGYHFISRLGLIGSGFAIITGYLAMNIITYLWINLPKDRFLRIQYEWKRIFLTCIGYVSCCVFALFPKTSNIWIEFCINISAQALIAIYFYKLLAPEEKAFILNPHKWKNIF